MKLICDFSKTESKKTLYENFKKLEGLYVIEIKKDRKTRSNQQSRYYWGVVLRMVSEYTGFTIDEAHELFKGKFLSYDKAFKDTGEAYTITRHTYDLDTLEFENYLEQIRIFAATEIEIVIPLPNECLEL